MSNNNTNSIQVTLCREEEAHIICNMYPYYLYDLSEIWERLPNSQGVFDEEEYATLHQQSDVFLIWWRHPGVLYPWIIRVNGVPAGFALIATAPYLPAGSSAQYYLNEFFVMRPFRGQGVAQQAASHIFEQYKGDWELQTNASSRNRHTQSFWNHILSQYTENQYSQQEITDEDQQQLLSYCFNNQQKNE